MFLNTNYYNCYFVRDAEVAGSNPVASTSKKARKINVSGLSLSSPWPLKILRSKQNSKQIVPNLYRPLSFPSSQINLFPHYGYPAGIMYPLTTLNRGMAGHNSHRFSFNEFFTCWAVFSFATPYNTTYHCLVVAGSAWPSHSASSHSPIPSRNRFEAQLCRRLCIVKSGLPKSRITLTKWEVNKSGSKGFPSSHVNRYGLSI